MSHLTVDQYLNPAEAKLDSAQARQSYFTCILFTGSRAPMRIAEFVRNYVNNATIPDGEDKSDPANWTVTERGLPAAFLHTIYYAEGMWYVFYNNFNAYDAATFPFNKIPHPSDPGND
jgi:hypothetical protein